MKKVTRILGLACLAGLLVFSACKKKETTSSVNVTIPHMTVATVDGERAYLDESYEFQWSGGDEICVYNLSDQYDQSTMQIFHNVTGAGPVATFSGPEVGAPMKYKYFYFYPTGMVSCDATELENGNRQTFYVAPTQQFESYWTENHEIMMADASQMPMAINTDNIHFNSRLNHMFGIGSITLKAKKNNHIQVASITITDNVFNLWGSASVRLHAVDTIQLWDAWQAYADGDDATFETAMATYIANPDGLGWMPNGDGGKSITLNCMHMEDGEYMGQELGQTPNKTEFNFLLRPLALSGGFTVDVVFNTPGMDDLHITSWNQPDRDYSIMPALINQWNYTKALTDPDHQ
jgi:hypothetical protein